MTRGTANVFIDLGFPDAVERQVKLRLAYALNHLLAARHLSAIDIAKVLGVTQPEGPVKKACIAFAKPDHKLQIIT